IPGTLPMRRTTIRSRLFPVRTLTALPMVMCSRLTLFTSVILSPTHRPASSGRGKRNGQHGGELGTTKASVSARGCGSSPS
uniref:Uncharacterized protein n=1 Tax=Sphenodon punctatus TaxID=8508 RepID=A0A8D0H651_SPHPU